MVQCTSLVVGEFEFSAHHSGDPENDLVIFLHGFPESSIMWSGLMEMVSARGFYCFAPDLRGYSAGACPHGIKNYSMELLRQDVTNIADTLGREKFHLVGHDWGALIGWSTAFQFSGRIKSWSALSVPHSRSFVKAYKTSREQRKKSSYIRWFMLPVLPELLIRRADFKTFRKLWRRSEPSEVSYNLKIFRNKASLNAALNYYRANFARGKRDTPGEIIVPSLFIWGRHDLAVSRAAAEGNKAYMAGPYRFLELDAGHWLVQSAFKEVAAAVFEHINEFK